MARKFKMENSQLNMIRGFILSLIYSNAVNLVFFIFYSRYIVPH